MNLNRHHPLHQVIYFLSVARNDVDGSFESVEPVTNVFEF